MTRGAMSCNWIFMMALATGIPGSRRRCFANCSVLLPRAPSLIDTFEAASLMPNYRLRTKRHWASAGFSLRGTSVQIQRHAGTCGRRAESPPQVEEQVKSRNPHTVEALPIDKTIEVLRGIERSRNTDLKSDIARTRLWISIPETFIMEPTSSQGVS